jgi:hypothetical protein
MKELCLTNLLRLFLRKYNSLIIPFVFYKQGISLWTADGRILVGEEEGLTFFGMVELIERIMQKDVTLIKLYTKHPTEVDFFRQLIWSSSISLSAYRYGDRWGGYSLYDFFKYYLYYMPDELYWLFSGYIPEIEDKIDPLPICIGSKTFEEYLSVIKEIGGKPREGVLAPCINSVLSRAISLRLYLPRVILEYLKGVYNELEHRYMEIYKEDLQEMEKLIWELEKIHRNHSFSLENIKDITDYIWKGKIDDLILEVYIYNDLKIESIESEFIDNERPKAFLTEIGLCRAEKTICTKKPSGERTRIITGQ